MLFRSKERAAARQTGSEATTIEMADLMARHPLAQTGEPLLVVATDEREQIEGFIANHPTLFRIAGEDRRVRWLASAFLRADLRGKGLIGDLIGQYTHGEKDCVTAGSSPPVIKGIKKFGWQQVDVPAPPVLPFHRLAPVLFKRDRLHASKRPLLRILSRIQDTLSRPLLRCWAFTLSLSWRFKYRVERADDRTEELLPLLEDHGRDGFVRTAGQIRWMLKHPWFSPTRQSDSASRRYEFFFEGKTLK